MDHRSDDLFVVDAEQAVKELAQYGAGASELRLDRLTGSLTYFASVLLSIGLELEAEFATDYSVAISTMDEGDGRRTARDFANLVQEQLDAIRQQQAYADNREAFDRLRLRFEFSEELRPDPRVPAVDRHMVDRAVKTIAAVDELAARLLMDIVPSKHDTAFDGEPVALTGTGPNTQDSDPENQDLNEVPLTVGLMTAHDQRHDNQYQATSDLAVGGLRIDIDSMFEAAAEQGRTEEIGQGLTGSTEKIECVTSTDVELTIDEVFGHEEDHARVDATTAPSETEVNPTASELEGKDQNLPIPSALQRSSPIVQLSTPDSARSNRFEKNRIDALFSRALKVASTGPWVSGFSSLIEAIDELDQIPFVDALPSTFEVFGQRSVRVHPELVRFVVDELSLLGQFPSIGLSSASSTLSISMSFDQPVRSDRMARIVARCAGRIESNPGENHWRLVLPASLRLLRVMPIKIDDYWVAASWAQYLDVVQESAKGIEVKLLLGDVQDRIVAKDLGLVSVGVRFDLPVFLRRRDRFRGLIMLSDGRLLPLLG